MKEMVSNKTNHFFHKLANLTSRTIGSPPAFIVAILVILIWMITGPIFKFSDTWQLVINTGTTIVTFLIVFLIQNTQNRDSHAIHVKLDELIRAHKPARNQFIGAEYLTDSQLETVQKQIILHNKKKKPI